MRRNLRGKKLDAELDQAAILKGRSFMDSNASGPSVPRSAVVLGATGAVGGQIVRALLQSHAWHGVTTLGRRLNPEWDTSISKLSQRVIDVFDPKAYAALIAGHTHAFCAFGIGQPSKVPREEFRRVDIDAVRNFAAACRDQGIGHFSVMTSVGSSPDSSIRYLRLKGELERDIEAMGFARASVFRPSMLITPANRYGLSQGFMLKAMPVFDLFLHGALRRFRSIKVSDLGQAMVRNAERPGQGCEYFEWDGFQKLLRP